MKITKKDLSLLLMGLCFLAFVFWFSLSNFPLVQETIQNPSSYSSIQNQIQETYTSDALKHKLDFVNLNGLYARISGRQELNTIYRTKNGMITLLLEEQNMDHLADNLIRFSESLRATDIPFLYVQAPYKEDFEDTILPDGVHSYGNENADALLSQLEAEGVDICDLRPHISATAELIDAYYFRTDHHWNIDGAFLGFQQICHAIDDIFPQSLDLNYTDKTLWQRHTKEDWFLGSRGKRVGIWFGGVDDYSWLTPIFPTQITTTNVNRGKQYSGNFEAANIRPEYLKTKDYFGTNVYCNYIGGDYALVQHRNPDAPNPQKILIIKDSYTLPVQAFLSTIFQQVEVIDPRYYPNYDITTYALISQPDLVMMLMNPSAFPIKEYMDFGRMDPAFANLRPMKEPAGDIILPEQNSINLGYGRVYRLEFEDFITDNPEITQVMAAVMQEGSGTPVQYQIFDLKQGREKGSFTWLFTTPRRGNARLKLVLLNGTSLYGTGTYRNVTLSTAALS